MHSAARGWLTLQGDELREFDAALAAARAARTGVYIEVVTGRYVSSELALKPHDAMQVIYAA